MSSICVTESITSRRMLDEENRLSDAQQRQREAVADLADEFVRSIEEGEPDATPGWTGTVGDYAKARELGIAYSAPDMPRRRSTVAECLQSGLDYSNGPDMGDVLRVLSLAMRSTDPLVSIAARQLVERTAAKFAEMNAGDES